MQYMFKNKNGIEIAFNTQYKQTIFEYIIKITKHWTMIHF